MSATRKHNPTRQIELRQKHEEHVAKYQGVAVDHQRAHMRSQWEQATDKKIGTTAIVRAMDAVQARHDEVLMARRMRLAELLKAERDEHEAMLASLVVTDDQRRERLMQQARDLRVERESVRRGEADRRKDQLFREQSSLVRDAESRIKVLHVAAERQAQIDAAKRKKEAEQQEDAFWEEQQREEQRQQAARSQRDLQRMHERARQVNADLAMQVERNGERKLRAKEHDRREDEQLVAEVRQGLSKDQQAEADRRAKQHAIAAETRELNETLKAKKEAHLAELRDEEKKELDQLLGTIAADERKEQQRKREAREEAARQMKYVEAQMNAQAESETALDRQWQEEADAVWAKRESQWQREADKRTSTLKGVYQTRVDQIKEARQKEEAELHGKRKEHDELVEQGNILGKGDADAASKRRAAAIANREFVQRQMAEKQAAKDEEKRAKRNELTSTQATEKMYEEKIGQELQKLDGARPAQFAHVKLGSRKQPL